MIISSIDAATREEASARAADAVAISAAAVSKRYGRVTALDGLTLDIRVGEVFGHPDRKGLGKVVSLGVSAW